MKVAHSIRKTFWLSFDLGIKGDYESMYKWLDKQGAKECGDQLAVIKYSAEKGKHIDHITFFLKKHVTFRKNDRVYIIWFDEVKKKVSGRFIIGGRKAAPWEGFSKSSRSKDVDF